MPASADASLDCILLYNVLPYIAQPGRDNPAFDRFPEAHRANRRLIQRDLASVRIYLFSGIRHLQRRYVKKASQCQHMFLSIDSCGRDRFSNRHMATFELLQQFRSFKGSASIPCGRVGTRQHKSRCYRYSRTKFFACRFFERWCCRDDDRPVVLLHSSKRTPMLP